MSQPFSGVETAARERARELLFDYLVVARRGMSTPPARAARPLASSTGASVIEGSGDTTVAETAALINGIAAHAIELDDTYEPASLHPGVVVWPAVLALGDERGSSLGQVLDAAVYAYDVIAAVGDRLDPDEAYARGFHPTGICGPIGAAVAAGHMLELDPGQIRNAVGVAASASSGLIEFLTDGSWTKPFHAGHAAQSGIVAARLAAAGYLGPARAIEGSHGFLHAFGRRDEDRAPLAPGAGRGVVATAVKLYPCCRYTHGCIDLLLDLVGEVELAAADVEWLSCGVLAAGSRLVAHPIEQKRRVRTTVEAQFSMPFTAALALTRQAVTLEGFNHVAEIGRQLEPLMDRIDCHRSERLEAEFPEMWGAEIVIRTRGGTTIRRHQNAMRGAASRPLSRDELMNKACRLVAGRTATALSSAVRAPADTPMSVLRSG